MQSQSTVNPLSITLQLCELAKLTFKVHWKGIEMVLFSMRDNSLRKAGGGPEIPLDPTWLLLAPETIRTRELLPLFILRHSWASRHPNIIYWMGRFVGAVFYGGILLVKKRVHIFLEWDRGCNSPLLGHYICGHNSAISSVLNRYLYSYTF